ncbi:MULTISPECIES: acyl-CoA carboxylase subunit epsilon [Streptomyces]|uniref:Acyl-CoA carboxylase subunit epsilon n=2 Tax=Streptomyces TaxID=1883 RepID=A0ABD5JR40_9ACTN|nr:MULTISPECIES: acyl-CoA carboxylase subunit epsilon [Streptomyces]MEE4590192.1 acyl-CoA carboxylase subunit epsilon [Streptomyces sp. DSM 41602]QTI90155.1 acyl-CoA carboxylase subunit epsilon [Streptomyces sp. AgN23]WJD95021.1 acyl-CoA carboxylase subunit epsilon [Streptomyces antimycoticus]WTA86198.1 acyl-CoA carboxylase subunit epsilon [Streptomyces antimycoticus]WTB03243.1 acyl-CoA carboxylase subunit epsilon [Streptomyces antimycoticus]
MAFTVVRGNPTHEELAAALVVIQARAAATSAVPATPRRLDEWAVKTRNFSCSAPPQPGPAAWRSSYWPR